MLHCFSAPALSLSAVPDSMSCAPVCKQLLTAHLKSLPPDRWSLTNAASLFAQQVGDAASKKTQEAKDKASDVAGQAQACSLSFLSDFLCKFSILCSRLPSLTSA